MKHIATICLIAATSFAGDIVTVDKDGKMTTRQETPAELAARKAIKLDEPPAATGPTLADQLATIATNQARSADALRKAVPSTTNDLKSVPSIAVKTEAR
jgi:hypothetical protein